MEQLDSSTLLLIVGWSLAAVIVGLTCGFFIGRLSTMHRESQRLREDREKTLGALLNLIKSTDQLNQDVGEHNSALVSARKEIESLQLGDFELLQSELMSSISKVVESNRRLEGDLIVSRYQLETQAQELDKTRIEARTDPLCQVSNRKEFDERLAFLVSRFHREQSSFGLMLVDVDHFKRINDTFGHATGDEVLVSIAKVLKKCVRPCDFVGRLGGDEFVMLIDGVNREFAPLVGVRLRESIERHDFSINANGQTTVVSLSMGLAVVNETDSVQSLFERADRALYQSKKMGRNRLSTLLDEDFAGSPQDSDDDANIDYKNFKQAMLAESSSSVYDVARNVR